LYNNFEFVRARDVVLFFKTLFPCFSIRQWTSFVAGK